nr:hypothetical protein [Tanacetum cinerariifolium]GEY22798.1 hypothetical protein [Tanacetum cinerariifolium]
MVKFETIPKRLKEDYHSIKDDTPLVNVYTTEKVTVKGMLILDDLLTNAIRDTQEYKDYKEKYGGVEVPTIQSEPIKSTQRAHRTPRATRTPNPTYVVYKKQKRKQVTGVEKIKEREKEESDGTKFVDLLFLSDEDFGNRTEPASHKENPDEVDDDDNETKDDEKEDDDNDNDDDDDHTDHALIKNQRTDNAFRKCDHDDHQIDDALPEEEKIVNTEQQHGLNYMEQIITIRENDKPSSFSEANFNYLNKNNIEDMYYICMNKKLGIESYQIKINLTAPTLIFSGEKRVKDLVDILKFCDATLEKLLKEVKLKIFEIEFLKKAPLLGYLDLKIMTEIKKSLSHREKMRR